MGLQGAAHFATSKLSYVGISSRYCPCDNRPNLLKFIPAYNNHMVRQRNEGVWRSVIFKRMGDLGCNYSTLKNCLYPDSVRGKASCGVQSVFQINSLALSFFPGPSNWRICSHPPWRSTILFLPLSTRASQTWEVSATVDAMKILPSSLSIPKNILWSLRIRVSEKCFTLSDRTMTSSDSGPYKYRSVQTNIAKGLAVVFLLILRVSLFDRKICNFSNT